LGTPEELKNGLTEHGLMNLESSDPLETMRAIEGLAGVRDVAVFGGGLHVTVDDAAATGRRIREALAAKAIEVKGLEQIRPSMEDVFVAMIEAEERRAA
jgi:ABC-2 type transport system ATP-binding protein